MISYKNFILKEADSAPSPSGSPPAGASADLAQSPPPGGAPPGFSGGPPMGMDMGMTSSGGMGGIGGMGGPTGSAGDLKAEPLKSTNIWDIFDEILKED